jgi:hypothetical protein
MDPATLALLTGVVTTGLTTFGASATVTKYANMILAALPHAITAGEDAYAFFTTEISSLWGMIHGGTAPTDDQWNALDGQVISVLARLQKQATPTKAPTP